MIDEIFKKVLGNTLFVTVTCVPRIYAKDEIKYLTTEQILVILNKEHKIISAISEPAHPVGNSQRRGMRLTGQWSFRLDAAIKKGPAKTAAKRRPKRQKKISSNANSPLRERMSVLASGSDETDSVVDKNEKE